MRVLRWIKVAMPVAMASVAGFAPLAQAQRPEAQLFEWTGRVDREMQIVMRENSVWANPVGPTEPGRGRARLMTAMPRQAGLVRVRLLSGRGNVDVIQQPTPQNGFTTIVRV